MKERLKREILRKTFHLTGITVPISYVLFGQDVSLFYTSAALLAFIFLEFIRIRAHSLFPMAKTADLIERQNEKSTVAATVYFCIAAIIAIFFLSEKSVIIGLTAGLLSDTAAALIGVGLGTHALGHGKTWEGTVAGVVVAALVTLIFKANLATVLGVGLVFLVFDLLELGIDDNFTTPLLMVLVAYLFEVIV